MQADSNPRDRSTTTLVILVLALLIGIVFVAIPPDEDDRNATPFERGEKMFRRTCIACHHANLKKDVANGPPLTGTTYELLEMKLLSGKYPKGYTPKRNTQVMPLYPLTADRIRALYAYIHDLDTGKPN